MTFVLTFRIQSIVDFLFRGNALTITSKKVGLYLDKFFESIAPSSKWLRILQTNTLAERERGGGLKIKN